jgi:hypothetical protein
VTMHTRTHRSTKFRNALLALMAVLAILGASLVSRPQAAHAAPTHTTALRVTRAHESTTWVNTTLLRHLRRPTQPSECVDGTTVVTVATNNTINPFPGIRRINVELLVQVATIDNTVYCDAIIPFSRVDTAAGYPTKTIVIDGIRADLNGHFDRPFDYSGQYPANPNPPSFPQVCSTVQGGTRYCAGTYHGQPFWSPMPVFAFNCLGGWQVWAELTIFLDQNHRPVFEAPGVGENDQPGYCTNLTQG